MVGQAGFSRPHRHLEIDITARTRFSNYERLGVPELWRFDGTGLEIYVLQEGRYTRSGESAQFPGFALPQVIPESVAQSKT